jgi:hypothetical protein
VAAGGLLSSVRTITCSIRASESLRGLAGTGLIHQPIDARLVEAARHHFRTVAGQILSSPAIAVTAPPSAARTTMRDRSASA